jgi:hypothetical protein
MAREIKDARWANESKSKIWCTFHYDDGRILNAVVSDTTQGNPDWKEALEKFSIEELDKNTEEFLKLREVDHQIKDQREKERMEIAKNEVVFNAKLDAFNIDEVKNSKNTALKSKIRRAKSVVEVNAYTAILLMKELELLVKEVEKINDTPTK